MVTEVGVGILGSCTSSICELPIYPPLRVFISYLCEDGTVGKGHRESYGMTQFMASLSASAQDHPKVTEKCSGI